MLAPAAGRSTDYRRDKSTCEETRQRLWHWGVEKNKGGGSILEAIMRERKGMLSAQHSLWWVTGVRCMVAGIVMI